MKKLLLTGLLAIALLSISNAQYVAERTGYEGDFFSLEGALELFKESNTINQFERRLNRRNSWVNNLDLNYDGRTDYIRVEHNRSGSFHAIVLQAVISKWEVQDVAVIEIEKVSRYDAVLQIVGDPDLYGEEVIVESRFDNDRMGRNVSYRGYDNVYYWAPVQYIFSPRYVVYRSPYRWSYYPSWYTPWNPCGWNTYYPRVRNYYTNYHIVNVHRVVNVHNYYYPSRSSCNRVAVRARTVRKTHGHTAGYRNTRSKNATNFQRSQGPRTASGLNGSNGRSRTSSSGSTINKKPKAASQFSNGRSAAGSRSTAKPGRSTISKPNRVSKPSSSYGSSRSSTSRSGSRATPSKKPSSSYGSSRSSTSRSGSRATTSRKPSSSYGSSRSSSSRSGSRATPSKKPSRSYGSSRSSSSRSGSRATTSRKPSSSYGSSRSSSTRSSSRATTSKKSSGSKAAPRRSSSKKNSKRG